MTAPTTLYSDTHAVTAVEISIDEFLETGFGFFNAKIDYFSSHPNYEKLRNIADTAIIFFYSTGNPAVASAEFINEIENASLKEIKELLDTIDERID